MMSNEHTYKIHHMPCRELELELGRRTLIMGIVNVTPDSFSDGGSVETMADAIDKVQRMVEAGADIIDIGGESTRPGAAQVSAEEELRRVIPLIKELSGSSLQVPISIDTYKAEVAHQALEAGAHMINDVWGLLKDPGLATLAASYGCPIIITHNRERPGPYRHLVSEVIADLRKSIKIAHTAGVADEAIMLDPGIGFAKDLDDNLHMMRHLSSLVAMGYPVVLGTSRKSMIQRTLGLPANEVLEGTAATVALGIAQGCHIVRVHDVAEMNKVVRMTDAIIRKASAPDSDFFAE